MVEEEVPPHPVHSQGVHVNVMAPRTIAEKLQRRLGCLYCLVATEPFLEASPNNKAEELMEDLSRLANEFVGLPDLAYRSSSTFYSLSFVDLACECDSLRGKVQALRDKYPDTAFSLIQSGINHLTQGMYTALPENVLVAPCPARQ